MMRNSNLVQVGIMLLLMLVLQGCGRKGPLFLPKDVPPSQSQQKN
jgi:predicted small lipoprotein YifL